jgi:hypothetical protein
LQPILDNEITTQEEQSNNTVVTLTQHRRNHAPIGGKPKHIKKNTFKSEILIHKVLFISIKNNHNNAFYGMN